MVLQAASVMAVASAADNLNVFDIIFSLIIRLLLRDADRDLMYINAM